MRQKQVVPWYALSRVKVINLYCSVSYQRGVLHLQCTLKRIRNLCRKSCLWVTIWQLQICLGDNRHFIYKSIFNILCQCLFTIRIWMWNLHRFNIVIIGIIRSPRFELGSQLKLAKRTNWQACYWASAEFSFDDVYKCCKDNVQIGTQSQIYA